MSLGYFQVRGVMSGSYLQCSCAERSINRIISDYGDFLPYNREAHSLANDILVALILGIYCHSRVAEESFRSGGSHGDEALALS